MIENQLIQKHDFLREMYEDSYFPRPLVDKGKTILLDLCQSVETDKPEDLDAFYVLTHAATQRFNDLEPEFEAANSELETAAREAIAEDFAFIASAYMFDADVEEMISPRNW